MNSKGAHSPDFLRQVIAAELSRLTPRRRERLLAVVSRRSQHLVGVMENIYDQGNVHAVIRSSESFGFFRLGRVSSQRQKESSRTTSGAHKWVRVTDYPSIGEAIADYRSQGYRVGATALTAQAVPLDQVDFGQPTALIFGNEKEGCSPLARELSDFHCLIPMVGFTQSFNLSVAAAIAFYHVSCWLESAGCDYLLSPASGKSYGRVSLWWG